MAVRLFNTLTRRVEDFVPLDPAGKTVGLYCCGPTVYDFAHIGNIRTFVFADLVRRWLEFRGFFVKHVMNITDVEDKIIRKVRETGATLRDFTGRYEAEFFKDLETVGCLKPTETPRATEHIADIVGLIARLIDKGVAYKAADGSVYFSIEKYRGCGCHYGQLVNLNFEEMRVGERVASDEYEKESVADFALWKARVPDDGDVFWESPWGQGRPGWHIECSAMSMKALGESFDLHLGGEDLMFPHHEDEIAQSEGATGKPFVKHWMHGMHLLVEGKKMSKSLGNFFTLRDLLAKGFSGREIRYLLLTAHYREQFNFTLEGLNGAKTALARIDECIAKVQEIAQDHHTEADEQVIGGITEALDDDLNVSKAWAVVFEWVRTLNRSLASNTLTSGEAKQALATVHRLSEVFGFRLGRPAKVAIAEGVRGIPGTDLTILNLSDTKAGPEIYQMVIERHEAKKSKDFKRSDAIRDELKSQGWVIEDTPKGPRLKKV